MLPFSHLLKKIFKIISRIFYSYLFTGCFSLGLTAVYLYLRDGQVEPSSLNPLNTIFLWPISSFSSAREIFGTQQAQIWQIFNISAILLFVFLAISSLVRKY